MRFVRPLLLILTSTIAVILASILWSACSPDVNEVVGSEEVISVADVLRSAPNDDFETINGPPDLSFPRDHGPHRKQQIEWWYYTGNLKAENGDLFGFQLTFFRIGLTPEAVDRPSLWAANESFMAHFALTDVARQEFYSSERLSRGSMGLAGAEATPFRVWTESWSAVGNPGSTFPMKLQAADRGVELSLSLTQEKPRVLQGDQGYSRKGKDVGNASGYVSHTRLSAAGSIVAAGRKFTVTGSAWMDHEWSTSVLDEGLVGWDWFSLHLDDGRELMLYQLRDEDGSSSEFSAGAMIDVDGKKQALKRSDFVIQVKDTWTSPRTGRRYPARWILEVPTLSIRLEVEPLLADQELQVSVNYWEGAVRAKGTTTASGYVELVGY